MAAAGCTQPEPHTHQTKAVRPTIVSLNPCGDAILAEVTAPGQLLAVSHYSKDPTASSMGVDKARRFAAVSGSVEEIARLQPDIVVADVFLPATTAQALKELGIAVVTIGNVDSIEASEVQIRQLAAVAGNTQAGEQLVSRIEQALGDAAPAARTRARTALVWELGGIVAGDTTLIADLLRRTGFSNAAAARGLSQANYLPLEAVMADPPDIILAVGDPRYQEDRLLSHPALASLTHTRRFNFDNALVWCGGPTIIRAAAELARIHRAANNGPA